MATAATPSIVRKKRNFKALQLDVATPPPAPQPEPTLPAAKPAAPKSAARAGGGGRRKPPGLVLNSAKPAAVPPPEDPNMLNVDQGLGPAPTSAHRNYQATLAQQLGNMSIGSGDRLDLKMEDLREVGELGQGNGGSVKKVEHTPTGIMMAKKVVLIDAKPSVRKQILRELQIMHDCHSQYIISFHGAFVADPNICICMEFMDKSSLDGIYKKTGPIPIDVIGKIAHAVLEGLTYLYDVHRIIHRDIKPSNILFNSKGQIKICDFGVSGELINSIADTFVGTSTYMSPERIQGAPYTVKSDVWSMGISLIELALGRFPFADSDSDSDDSDLEGTLSPGRPLSGIPYPTSDRSSRKSKETSKKDKRKSKGVSLQGGGMTMSILELLQHIVNEPAPKLTPEGRFPAEAEDFVDACLFKDPIKRPSPQELLKHQWIDQARTSDVDLAAWAATF